MKVLEKGPGWSIKQTCTGRGNGGGGCNSLLEVEATDIYVTSLTDYLGDTDYYFTFKCIICGRETDIPSKEVPSSVQKDAMNNKRKMLTRGVGYLD